MKIETNLISFILIVCPVAALAYICCIVRDAWGFGCCNYELNRTKQENEHG